ncbi:MAG: hypothetical protein IKC67_03020 [Odoribacter sp.]|nr:hypothetical protein [Odoribacter sp.]
MGKFGILVAAIAFCLSACSSGGVTVRGELTGFNGTAKMSAEMPGQGMVVLAEQQVTDGAIELKTTELTLPARVWFTFNNGTDEYTRDFIVDQVDKTKISGKGKYLDQMTITGSVLNKEYLVLKGQIGEKYDGAIAKATKAIEKLRAKEKPTTTDRTLLVYNQNSLDKNMGARFRYIKSLIEANPDMEIVLFVMKDLMKDSVDVQREVFNKLNIPNKTSNIYMVLDAELNGTTAPAATEATPAE